MISKKTKIFLIISLVISLVFLISINIKEIKIKKQNEEATTRVFKYKLYGDRKRRILCINFR